jgi:hypothetical protein
MHIQLIKSVLETLHGRKGSLAERAMFFAVPVHANGDNFWIQVDVKVCEKEKLFEWERFTLQYASMSKILGSILKPLGVTIDPEGCWLRVEGLDAVNHDESMVWLTLEPSNMLKILGLDHRMLKGVFKDAEESKIYY